MNTSMHEPNTPAAPPRNKGPLPPRRLFRNPTSRGAGVASGLAAYFHVDPAIARLLFLLSVFTGMGIPVYLICWITIPKASQWPPPDYEPPNSWSPPTAPPLTAGLLAIALASILASWAGGVGNYLFPAALIGFGIYLLNQPRTRPVDDSPLDELDDLDGLTSTSSFTATDPSSPASAREQGQTAGFGHITPVVLTILALSLGSALLLQAAGVYSVPKGWLAIGGLTVVAIGLLASRRYGHAPGLSALGAVFGLATVVYGVGHSLEGCAQSWDPAGQTGDYQWVGDRDASRLTDLAQLQPSYRLGAGELSLDLTELDFTQETRHVDIRQGLGDLKILLPATGSVRVDVRQGAGSLLLFGQRREGVGLREEASDLREGTGMLTLSIRLGAGEVKVQRVD